MGVAIHSQRRDAAADISRIEVPPREEIVAGLETSVGLLNSGSAEPLPVAVTMGAVIKRYRKEYLPDLSSKSARDTYEGALRLYIEPKWSKVAVADVKAMDVDKWLKSISAKRARHDSVA